MKRPPRHRRTIPGIYRRNIEQAEHWLKLETGPELKPGAKARAEAKRQRRAERNQERARVQA